MAFSDQFTGQEWEALAGLPRLVATAASYADGYRVVENLREQWAGSTAIAEAATRYPESLLIQEIATERGVEIGDRPDPAAMVADNVTGIRQAIELSLTQAELANRALARLQHAEAAVYREWVVMIAETVVSSAKRGAIMGVGGVRVDALEADYVSRLAAALGAQSSIAAQLTAPEPQETPVETSTADVQVTPAEKPHS
jgi:hypothetical protein